MGSGYALPQHAVCTYFPVEWKHLVCPALIALCVVKGNEDSNIPKNKYKWVYRKRLNYNR